MMPTLAAHGLIPKKQGDAHAAQRGDGPKSQEINLPDMESNCQHEAEETTQTLNTSEKSTVLFPGQSAVRWWSHFTHLSDFQQPADTHLPPLLSQLHNLFS